MKRKRVMIVMGTRPEVIKFAPIIKELKKYPGKFIVELVWTGQHKEIAAPFIKLFGLKPKYYLEIMKPNQTLSGLSSKVLEKLEPIMKKAAPHLVMTQGDTASAFIASLSAFFHKVPVAHLEAGLRTYDKFHPFPEEKNRELLSHIADIHFAPTKISRDNLTREGINRKHIFVVGNSVVDALKWLVKKYPPPKVRSNGKTLLVTVHRRESFGEPIRKICEAVAELVKKHKDLEIIFPVHPNPNVKKVVQKILGSLERVKLLPPLDYISFVHTLSRSTAVLTDSGGVQEEAPCLGKKAIVVREVTERPEGIISGANILAGRDRKKIISAVESVLYGKKSGQIVARYPFGKGDTAKRVVKILSSI